MNEDKIRLSFDFVDGGLTAKDGHFLNKFTIAGDNQKFFPSKAMIQGGEVVVWSEQVTNLLQ